MSKTLINGTEYTIKGGKTLINGTGYSVKQGSTLVGGTAYSINFGDDIPSGFTFYSTFSNNDYTLSDYMFALPDGNIIARSGFDWNIIQLDNSGNISVLSTITLDTSTDTQCAVSGNYFCLTKTTTGQTTIYFYKYNGNGSYTLLDNAIFPQEQAYPYGNLIINGHFMLAKKVSDVLYYQMWQIDDTGIVVAGEYYNYSHAVPSEMNRMVLYNDTVRFFYSTYFCTISYNNAFKLSGESNLERYNGNVIHPSLFLNGIVIASKLTTSGSYTLEAVPSWQTMYTSSTTSSYYYYNYLQDTETGISFLASTTDNFIKAYDSSGNLLDTADISGYNLFYGRHYFGKIAPYTYCTNYRGNFLIFTYK